MSTGSGDAGIGSTSWDVVVVGGGAAGLSAALTLSRARRSVLVLDDGTPRNAAADGVHNYLGREGTPPSELVAIGRAEVEGYGATVRSARVVTVARLDDGGFSVGTDAGDRLEARRLVVATGTHDELPDVPGLAERWGRDVLHCPYCHGWEVRDRRIGVLATSPLALHQAQLLRQWSDDVVLLVGDVELTAEQREELDARGIEVVEGTVIAVETGVSGVAPQTSSVRGSTSITADGGPDDRLAGVRLASGEVVALDALAVAPVMRARAAVPAMLGVDPVELRMGETVVGDAVPVDTSGSPLTAGATAVPGLYAIGNVADLRSVVIGAAAAGTATAAAVNADLVAEDVRTAVAGRRAGLWEDFYAARERIWSGRPNAVLVETVADLTPGTALDLGAGEGGDAVWLAERGWKVTAVDIAAEALTRLAGAAAERGLAVETQQHDLAVTFPAGTYDLVSAHYLHSPHAWDRPRVLRAAADAVAPGGLLLVVGHGVLAPWSWDPTLVMPTAREVVDGLGLDPAAWTVERVASPERVVEHEGHDATITDEIVAVRRRPVG